tara:strand:+ start:5036 stop:5602 length:567 start_codon:yes stop_codon:yes gene_type:complete
MKEDNLGDNLVDNEDNSVDNEDSLGDNGMLEKQKIAKIKRAEANKKWRLKQKQKKLEEKKHLQQLKNENIMLKQTEEYEEEEDDEIEYVEVIKKPRQKLPPVKKVTIRKSPRLAKPKPKPVRKVIYESESEYEEEIISEVTEEEYDEEDFSLERNREQYIKNELYSMYKKQQQEQIKNPNLQNKICFA